MEPATRVRTLVAKAGVIGLDIGTTHVRAAEVRPGSAGPGGEPPTLVRYGQVALPLGAVRDGEVAEPAAVTSALRRLWSEVGFSTRDVNIGVGNQRVVVRELELPWMPLTDIRASLPFQVSELIPMSPDEAVLDYYPTGETDGPAGRMVQGMLVAATRDTVNANVMAVESAGLRPQLVDLNPFALLRALARGELAGRTVALVEVGARITQVSSPPTASRGSSASFRPVVRTSPTPSPERSASLPRRPRASSARSASVTPSAPTSPTRGRPSARSSGR